MTTTTGNVTCLATAPYAGLVAELAKDVKQFKPEQGVIIYGPGIDCLDEVVDGLKSSMTNGTTPVVREVPAATLVSALKQEYGIVVVRDRRPARPEGTVSESRIAGYYVVDLEQTLPYHKR